MTLDNFQILYYVFLALTIVFFILSIVFFFVFDIRRIFSIKTGRAIRKSVEELNEINRKEDNRRRRKYKGHSMQLTGEMSGSLDKTTGKITGEITGDMGYSGETIQDLSVSHPMDDDATTMLQTMNQDVPETSLLTNAQNVSTPETELLQPQVTTSAPETELLQPQVTTSAPETELLQPQVTISVPETGLLNMPAAYTTSEPDNSNQTTVLVQEEIEMKVDDRQPTGKIASEEVKGQFVIIERKVVTFSTEVIA